MEVPGFVAASPQDDISGISIVPFPELLSMFDAVEDGCDVFSFDSMFYRFLINPERKPEHFTPQKPPKFRSFKAVSSLGLRHFLRSG